MTEAYDEECMNSPVKSLYSMKIVKDNNIHFLSERIYGAEDAIFNFQMLSHCDKIEIVHKSFYNYIIYDYSLSHNPDEKAEKIYRHYKKNI
jgi:formyltetrahydrofolate synthetase